MLFAFSTVARRSASDLTTAVRLSTWLLSALSSSSTAWGVASFLLARRVRKAASLPGAASALLSPPGGGGPGDSVSLASAASPFSFGGGWMAATRPESRLEAFSTDSLPASTMALKGAACFGVGLSSASMFSASFFSSDFLTRRVTASFVAAPTPVNAVPAAARADVSPSLTCFSHWGRGPSFFWRKNTFFVDPFPSDTVPSPAATNFDAASFSGASVCVPSAAVGGSDPSSDAFGSSSSPVVSDNIFPPPPARREASLSLSLVLTPEGKGQVDGLCAFARSRNGS
mmetsp:Transcript_15525/g.50899  ORF Transcript_15525/g.50899 Transcript_15525/m.50899 type:complete len:286 (-) Transcript_15525:4202-5059(-)